MNKISGLILAVVLGLAGIAQAEPLSVDVGGNTFYVPFQVVNATQLYSIKDGRGYPGAETVLVSRGEAQLTFGAAPVLGEGVNVPFVGLQTKLSPVYFDTNNNDLSFGLFLGKPSKGKEWTYGVKATIELW